MAHYEYTKTFSFYATAEVPYRYTCGKCGREVTGRAELAGKDEAKVSSRHADKLAISDQSREQQPYDRQGLSAELQGIDGVRRHHHHSRGDGVRRGPLQSRVRRFRVRLVAALAGAGRPCRARALRKRRVELLPRRPQPQGRPSGADGEPGELIRFFRNAP